MPSLNGIELIEKIKAITKAPIICISGMADSFSAELEEFDGVYKLNKPVRKEEIVEIIKGAY